MDDFYLTLPSNVLGQGVLNTTSVFTTILPKNISLEGQWKVALADLQYPFTWSNIGANEIKIRLKRNGMGRVVTRLVRVQVDQNYYHNVQAVIKHVNVRIDKALMDAVLEIDNEVVGLKTKSLSAQRMKQTLTSNLKLDKFVNFNYSTDTNRVSIELPVPDAVSKLSLTGELMYVLGFGSSDGVFTDVESVARFPPDMSAGLSAFYIYCDIVDSQIVGDKTAPLLRVVPLNTSNHTYGQTIVESFVNPHYVNVLSKWLCTLTLSINTDQNIPVKFNFGKTVVKLHFKKYA